MIYLLDTPVFLYFLCFFFFFFFFVCLFLSASLPLVLVETQLGGYLIGKELVILLFKCVVVETFCGVFSFLSCIYVGTLASIPGCSFLTLYIFYMKDK